MPKGPITPDEVMDLKKDSLPQEVFDAFNHLIAKTWDGHSAVVKQKEAAALIASKTESTTDQVYKNHWLDVEEVYRTSGWIVLYDKPGFNESYDAYFVFKKCK